MLLPLLLSERWVTNIKLLFLGVVGCSTCSSDLWKHKEKLYIRITTCRCYITIMAVQDLCFRLHWIIEAFYRRLFLLSFAFFVVSWSESPDNCSTISSFGGSVGSVLVDLILLLLLLTSFSASESKKKKLRSGFPVIFLFLFFSKKRYTLQPSRSRCTYHQILSKLQQRHLWSFFKRNS